MRSCFNGVIALTCVFVTLLAVNLTWRRVSTPADKPRLTDREANTLRLEYLNNTDVEKLIFLQSFPSFYELKLGSALFENCPVKTCSFTDSPEDLPTSDAVMFFTKYDKPPPPKTAGQIWIYFVEESPLYSGSGRFNGPEWENLINWTMSYRKNSDIVFGYGVVHNKTERAPPKDYHAIAKAKTKLIAWYVSNCNTQSQRMKYVKLLQQFVPVDIYGECGPFKCPRSRETECIEMLNKDYKFYLSFENSLCLDYVTEKVYRILKYDVVPIVRGGANYSRFFPIKSVINTSDFFTVRDLAEFIKHLDSNMDEYLKYFSWKTSYSIEEPQAMPLCEICEKVHSPEKWHKVYKNVADWWKVGTCRDPTDLVLQL